MLLAQIQVQPHHGVGPHGLFHLTEGIGLHMGVAGHGLHHALGPAEQGGDVLVAAHEGGTQMLALGGQLLPFIVGSGVVLVPEYLRRLKEGEVGEVALVLYHCLAEIGQQGGADHLLRGGGGRGQGQDAGSILQDGVYILLVHPRVGENFL